MKETLIALRAQLYRLAHTLFSSDRERCPVCQSEMHYAVGEGDERPLLLVCENCGKSVRRS